jgi:hypothetical protein
MRQTRPYGFVRGVLGNWHSYPDTRVYNRFLRNCELPYASGGRRSGFVLSTCAERDLPVMLSFRHHCVFAGRSPMYRDPLVSIAHFDLTAELAHLLACVRPRF